MKFKYLLATSVVGLSAVAATPAFAQSTGSVDFEEDDEVIVVTGARFDGVGGVEVPDTSKAKQVLNEEVIRRQRPGQTVNDIVNLVPGVSFQNNDPWGSSGGGFTIRGFGSDRVSQTLDGLPLNDSGNYALYTNQQVDPEVLEEVNVNLGTTDVDSPTASATGGTINIRTREPGDAPGITATMTYGDVLAEGAEDTLYVRGFGMIDTGDFTGMGTKAFVSASYTTYGVPYNPYGRVNKTQQKNKTNQTTIRAQQHAAARAVYGFQVAQTGSQATDTPLCASSREATIYSARTVPPAEAAIHSPAPGRQRATRRLQREW